MTMSGDSGMKSSEILERRASGIPSVRYWNEKSNNAGTGPVPVFETTVRHFLVRYRTETTDDGMPVLAFVSPVPMLE